MAEDFKLSTSSSSGSSSSSSSSAFDSKMKDVFSFAEVKIKGGQEPAEDARARLDKSAVDAKDFKGRESLFRETEPATSWDAEETRRIEKEAKDKFAAFRKRNRGGFRRDDDGGNGGGDRRSSDRRVTEFKSPQPPNRRGGRGGRGGKTPDFRKNPQNYTKYTLEDTDCLDNAANSQAAFSFLRELDARKKGDDGEEEEEEAADLQSKITFKKPGRKREKDAEEEKVEATSEKKSKKPKEKKKSMMLSHLMDDEEEDEDDG